MRACVLQDRADVRGITSCRVQIGGVALSRAAGVFDSGIAEQLANLAEPVLGGEQRVLMRCLRLAQRKSGWKKSSQWGIDPALLILARRSSPCVQAAGA